MGFIGTLTEALRASSQAAPGGETASKGAYWCDDCDVRVRDVDLDDEEARCPECGDEMRFERSPGSSGCAC